MPQKKPNGVKSVTLGDVKASEVRTGIKAVPSSSSTIPPDISDEDLKELAKQADEDAKTHDQQTKEADKQAKQTEKEAKKIDRGR